MLIWLACIDGPLRDTGPIREDAEVYAIPNPLLFPDAPVGDAAVMETRLHNDGGTTVRVMDILYEGPYDNVELSGLELDPGRGLLYGVRFEPTVWGDHPGTATLIFDDQTELVLSLEGTALGPSGALSPSELDLGEVPVGCSATGELSLENHGNASLTVTGLTAQSPFEAELDRWSLEPGDTATVTVTFTAHEPSQATTTLYVESDGLDATASLTARGTEDGC